MNTVEKIIEEIKLLDDLQQEQILDAIILLKQQKGINGFLALAETSPIQLAPGVSLLDIIDELRDETSTFDDFTEG